MNGEVFEQAQEMKQLMEVALRIKQTRELLSFSVEDVYIFCILYGIEGSSIWLAYFLKF